MHPFPSNILYILACLGLFAGSSAADQPSDVPSYPGYVLAWHDEFNTDGPPTEADWIYERGFVRNQEAQWYQSQNVRCAGGNLIIEAKREEVANPDFDPKASDWRKSRPTASYTSGSIKTAGKHSWTYGRFEMRGRFCTDVGCWPAFWTVGSGSPNQPARSWPAKGELDIMEYYRGTLLANAAWASAKPGAAQWRDSKTPLESIAREAGFGEGPAGIKAWSAAFHTWRMDWTPESITFSVDGRQLNRVDITATLNATEDHANPFHEPHHIILNLAIGGTSGGDPSATEFPRRFEVDWVRIYQRAATKPAAYAGIRFRQNAEGVVVGGVQPGPLNGDGFKSSTLWRGDWIASVNGKTLDAAGYAELIKSLAPGDHLRVTYRRSAKGDPFASVPQGDPTGEEHSVEFELQDAALWSGTVGKGLGERTIPPAEKGEFEDLLLSRAAELGVRTEPGGLDALLAHFRTVQTALLDPNSVAAVVQSIDRPLSMDFVERSLCDQVASTFVKPGPSAISLLAAGELISRTLDLPAQPPSAHTAESLSAARSRNHSVAQDLVRALRDSVTPGGPDLPKQLALLRESVEIVPLLPAAYAQAVSAVAELDAFGRASPDRPTPLPPDLAGRVAEAVKGEVRAAKLVDGELWVVGSSGANQYNMDLLGAVFDIGGDDVYLYSKAVTRSLQLSIDQSGNDTYSSACDFAGPASACFGVSILIDRSGNDTYSSTRQGSIACGVFGIGMLVDESGNDMYLNETPESGWSQGVGFYGAGILVDRAGNDTYKAQKLSQGVGGPRGLGLLCDCAGADTYVVNGPHFASVYGTPGVFVGMSQGFGYGIRGYAAGGLGAMYDFAGDDSYSVGEFGQGCGYYQGLGILHDAAGNDHYVGSRYAQGTGAHQAAGILVDESGDDSYVCPGPAGQGVAWDQTVAMLLDRSGADTYSAGGLAQGSAAQQAIGILIDLQGNDQYAAANACQGQGGDNTYHYDADRVFSFSALLDLGSGIDTYSTKRPNGVLLKTGTRNESKPASSDLFGIFLDQ